MEKPLKDVISFIKTCLIPKYGTRESKAMAEIIFENLKNWSPVDLVLRQDEMVSPFIIDKIGKIIRRLLNDEPIQYIFNRADFYGMKFIVNEDTLIPRPETAEMVDLIVNENSDKDLHVIDLGTGSGCIAIALSRNLKFADVTGVDIAEGALNVAKENGKRLAPSVKFEQGDILSETWRMSKSQAYDIIVSNPPYIIESEIPDISKNVLDYEPPQALFVPDNDPLIYYTAILAFARHHLVPNGKVYFEINPMFVNELIQLAKSYGFINFELNRDLYGKNRFLTLQQR